MGELLHFLELQWLLFKFIFQYLLQPFLSSQAIFLPQRRRFRSNLAFNFRIIYGVVTVFFRPIFGRDATLWYRNDTRKKIFIRI